MVNRSHLSIAAFALLIGMFLVQNTSAAIINVNEVLANEPGSDVSFEWIELYVDGATTNLSFYELHIGSTIITMTGTASSGDYILVCRDTAAVKARWAVPVEQTHVRYFQRSFSLTNSSGSVTIGLPGNTLSSLSWVAIGAQGVSWERESILTSAIVQSNDPLGATPGFVNSTTLLNHDLALKRVTAIPDSGQTLLDVNIANVSKGTFSGGVVRVFEADSLNPGMPGNEIMNQSLPDIDSGFSTLTRLILPSIPSSYAYLAVVLDTDDRGRNNQFALIVPGSAYPPFRLNEFLANPAPPQFSEWIELKNLSSAPLSLNGWKIGDVGSLNALPLTSVMIPSGSYIVLTQDSVSFKSSNPSAMPLLIQPTGWNQLGNSGDLIRLVDPYGYEADRFSWSGSLSDNHTHARDEDALLSTWGESEVSGGTPGSRNVVRLTASGDSISLVLDPPFVQQESPVHGEVSIRLNPPKADSYSLRIFDIEGREVISFLDHATSYRSTYVWNGMINGHAVTPGQYIVLLEAHGVESIRKILAVIPQ